MAERETSAARSNSDSNSNSKNYVVVARRYRPQSFQDLVGQGQVSQALGTAIQTNRVGHAYLFTGARGVGKTSTARIFAKALNCVKGPTPTPCNECDICRSIATGEDIDVLEIDGASNRGIDEIRQLRSNVGIRPSRAPYKVYIIDEVHMLTLQAFNALLKTLEEPPEHVKFIFCTTDPEKIPITILSRCQRFDFPPVEAKSIIERLRHIVETEGITAEEEALQLLARRANGSMRDSQSLLEQLLACCPERITVADVHAMLGTARSGQLAALATHLAAGNVAGTFQEVDRALREGVDAGQLAEQLVGYFRDVMAAAVDCGPEMMLHTMAADYAQLRDLGTRIGLQSLLAMTQILDQSISRMRYSAHVRTLLELALVRICQLEHLDDLSELIAGLRSEGAAQAGAAKPATRGAAAATPRERSGTAASSSEEKKTTQCPAPVGHIEKDNREKVLPEAVGTTSPAVLDSPLPDSPLPDSPLPDSPPLPSPTISPPTAETPASGSNPPLPVEESSQSSPPASPTTVGELSAASMESLWKEALASLGADMTADFARHAERLTFRAPNRLVVHFRAGYILHKEHCERPERKSKLEDALSRVASQTLRLDMELLPQEPNREPRPQPVPSARQRQREMEQHPLVRRAVEMFDAEVIRVDEPRGK